MHKRRTLRPNDRYIAKPAAVYYEVRQLATFERRRLNLQGSVGEHLASGFTSNTLEPNMTPARNTTFHRYQSFHSVLPHFSNRGSYGTITCPGPYFGASPLNFDLRCIGKSNAPHERRRRVTRGRRPPNTPVAARPAAARTRDARRRAVEGRRNREIRRHRREVTTRPPHEHRLGAQENQTPCAAWPRGAT